MQLYQSLKKTGLLYLLVLPVFFSCAQTKPPLKNVKAFYTVWMPGNIPVGADGEPLPGSGPKIIYSIYAETATPDITWDSASISGESFKILASLVKEKSIEAGLDKNTQQPVIVRPQNGGYLWRLDLQPNASVAKAIQPVSPQAIKLSGSGNGKKFSYIIENVVELYTHPSY